MVNPWFKFYAGEYLSDPKMLNLNGNERSCWITLMCLFSQNNGQEIKFLSEKQLLFLSGIQDEIKVLDRFEELGLILRCNGNVTLPNWEKRQYSEGYNRVKKFRDNKKITIEEKREEEKRIDKEELPIWLNKNKWNEWIKYLTEKKKKKPTQSTLKIHLNKLSKNITGHIEMIDKAIDRGWVSVFIPDSFTQQKRSPRVYEEPDNSKEEKDRRDLLNGQMKTLTSKMKI